MKPQTGSRRTSPVSLLLVLLILVVTGCGPAATEAPPVPSATVVQPSATPTTRPTETPVPTNTPIPTETPTPFVPKATFKIAGHGPQTGGLSFLGVDILRGAELAVEQLAGPLTGLGYAVEFAPSDDQDDFGVAVDVAKQIVADPDVLCLVGPSTSRILNQVKEIYHQAGLAFISPSATAAFATASGYLEVNRVVGRHDNQGMVGAQFAKAQGFGNVFVISQSGDYGEFNAFHFRNEASRLGMTVAGNISTDAMEGFGQLIDRILAADADLVYFSTLSVDQAGVFFREARAAGYTGAFLGNEGINAPALLEIAGPLLIEGGGMYYTAIAASAEYYPGAAQFIQDFETVYGAAPQIFAAQAYDAAGVCLRAIEEASKAKGGEIPTRAEVANAVRALQGYQGITGVFTFDKNGDPDPATYFVFQATSPDPADWNLNPLVATYEVSPPE